eukprot:scaffold5833_cov165-Amphora_coffeaeformis.AAC.15
MIVFPLETHLLPPAIAIEESKDVKPLVSTAPPSPNRRRQILTRRRKGRVIKATKATKSVAFEADSEGSLATQVFEYDDHDHVDTTELYTQDGDVFRCRQDCLRAVRSTCKYDPEYRKAVIQFFRSRSLRYTEADLDMLGESICRGLERKLSKVFISHRRWAVDGVLKMQDMDNDEECMRFFSKRASQPGVAFARLMAIADRKAADQIYLEESDEFFIYSGIYWSDSSRSLESTDSVDTP